MFTKEKLKDFVNLEFKRFDKNNEYALYDFKIDEIGNYNIDLTIYFYRPKEWTKEMFYLDENYLIISIKEYTDYEIKKRTDKINKIKERICSK